MHHRSQKERRHAEWILLVLGSIRSRRSSRGDSPTHRRLSQKREGSALVARAAPTQRKARGLVALSKTLPTLRDVWPAPSRKPLAVAVLMARIIFRLIGSLRGCLDYLSARSVSGLLPILWPVSCFLARRMTCIETPSREDLSERCKPSQRRQHPKFHGHTKCWRRICRN